MEKERNGSGERRWRDETVAKEESGDLNPSGFKGFGGENKTLFPSEPALIMRSC